MDNNSKKIEDYLITSEPYYEPVGNEISIFESAYQNQLPVLLKGPTGCGKTLSLIHISEPTRQEAISYAVFCLKKKKK